jgi:REP element-mobilizing transposase RayT
VAEKGWHSRGYLPHFDACGVVQHVVLSTRGALDRASLEQLSTLSPVQRRQHLDAMLDRSKAGTIFKDPRCAAAMETQFFYFDGHRYDLLAWCIMPNHVHVVLCCYGETSLGQIIRTWKVHTVRAISAFSGQRVEVFAKDYFDRFMRNGQQTLAAMAYVEHNPVAAGLCDEPEAWRFSSAWHKVGGWVPRTNNLPVTID